MSQVQFKRHRKPPLQQRSSHGRGKRLHEKQPPEKRRTARAHREAARLLKDIGRPEPRPFVPDRFQVEAVKEIKRQDVLVTAPTGSGKTWIAVEAVREYLSGRCKAWYATPLKALSNAKYSEFADIFGADRVGILTGDRKENSDAALIVGTTEILRNQLYDAMQEGRDLDVDLVVLDEAHYLGDPDRGVVWEEVLIYLPGRVRVLLLSATVSNAEEVAAWLTRIRKAPCAVVRSDVRPVPLHVLFRTPEGELTPFLRGGKLFGKAAELASAGKGRRRQPGQADVDINDIIEMLREFQLLPAIVFFKSRSDCDKALDTLLPSPMDPKEGGFASALLEQLRAYPELHNQRQVDRLLECRAGSHHAGQLPAWRLVIENLMVQGHLEAILSTSTVAAGVNYPARTVAILQSDRFNGQSFVDMTATEFHQMTGRAGRRGMDNAGFTLIVPGKYLNIRHVKQLLLSKPEPLKSKIAVNFSMVLNLLLSHDPAGVEELLGFSFAAFHENPRVAMKVHNRLLVEFRKHLGVLKELGYVNEHGVPTYDGKWAAQLRLDHPLLIAELIRQGALSGLSPEELASVVAPFVIDKEREILVSRNLWQITRPLWKKFVMGMRKLKPLMGFLVSGGFEVPSIMFWPAASVFLWAEQAPWSELTSNVSADEGDLAMIVLRTADHLRQLISLEGEQPKLAQTARDAIGLIMRSPVI